MKRSLKDSLGFIAGVVVGVIAMMLFAGVVLQPAGASGRDNDVTINLTINNVAPPVDTDPAATTTSASGSGDSGVSGNDYSKIFAMQGAADYCVFDYAMGWQGCGSVGFYDGSTGYNAMFATRVDDFMIKFGIQADEYFDEYAGGVGGSWHF